MKQEAMETINQTGRVGLVLTVILSLVCYIFMIYAIGVAIILHNSPDSLATITTAATVTIDMDVTDANLESSAVQTLQEYLEAGEEGASIGFGSLILYLSEYTSEGNTGHGVFGGDLSSVTLQQLWVAAVYLIIMLAATVVMLLFNGFFAKSLKGAKTPFDEKVVKDAGNLSFAIVIWGFVVAAMKALIVSVATGNVKIDAGGIIIIVLSVVIALFLRLYKNAASYYLA